MSLFVAALFYVLTPGILLTLPKGGSKVMVAATHAVVFALVYHFSHKMVSKAIYGYEGFKPNTDAKTATKLGAKTATKSK